MKYMLLIQHGDTPTPYDPEAWARVPDDEKKAISADYRAINETPGVTPGLWMDPPETATTVRVQDGRTLTTDGPFVAIKEALGGYLTFEADDLDAAIALAARRRPVRRQLRELDRDLVELQPDPLREDDERDPAQDGARVAAVA